MAPRVPLGAVATAVVLASCLRSSECSLGFGIGAANPMAASTSDTVLDSFTCTPSIVNTMNDDTRVTCSVRAINRKEDIAYVSTQLSSPSGKTVIPIWLSGELKSFGYAQGTGINFATTFTIPKGAEPGYWQFDFTSPYAFKAVTKSGKVTNYTPQYFVESGLSHFLKVYSQQDSTAPVIQDVVCDTPVKLNATRSGSLPVKCTFTVNDALSGVGRLEANFVSASGNNILYFNLDHNDVVSTSADNKTHIVVGTVPAWTGMEGGVYSIMMEPPFAPYVEDRAGNGANYEYFDTKMWTAPAVELFSAPDTVGPTIQRFSCPTNQLAVPYKGTNSIQCQMVLQDDLSGFQYGQLAFVTPDQDSTAVLRFDATSRQVEFSRGGIYAPQLTWSWEDSQEGMYTASADGLILTDYAGNTRQLRPKELNNAGFPTFFYVSKAKVVFQDVAPITTSPAPASWRPSFITALACLSALALARQMY